MSTAKLSHVDFVRNFEARQPIYSKAITFLSEYVNASTKISFLFNGNKHSTLPQGLLKGAKPCSTTATNKNDLFVKKAYLVHGDIYSYENINYAGSMAKIEIICKEHGSFLQSPHSHLEGHGCHSCGIGKISNAAKQGSASWHYNDWDRAGKISPSFESYKVYVIKCSNETESFFKIGKTFRKIKARFPGPSIIPYNIEIVKVISGEALEISNLEKELQKRNRKYKYTPLIAFKGQYECYSKIEL